MRHVENVAVLLLIGSRINSWRAHVSHSKRHISKVGRNVDTYIQEDVRLHVVDTLTSQLIGSLQSIKAISESQSKLVISHTS